MSEVTGFGIEKTF